MKQKVEDGLLQMTELVFLFCVAFTVICLVCLNLSITLKSTNPRYRAHDFTTEKLQHNEKSTYNKNNNDEIKILIWTTYYSGLLNFSAKCSVNRCSFHHDKSKLGISTSDAVLFHVWSGDFNSLDIPPIRFFWQNYIFFSLENPTRHTFSKQLNLTKFDGFFNLTATYKLDSDVPLPYGQYISSKTNLKPRSPRRNYYIENRRDERDKNATILWTVSHCNTKNKRMQFVKELQKHIKVDIFGKCGKPCARYRKCGTQPYMFYLALENADCKDYITEKVWKNALLENLIPIDIDYLLSVIYGLYSTRWLLAITEVTVQYPILGQSKLQLRMTLDEEKNE
ncbi:unnamed protein product [Owenia fusiformis]|uniref:Fucosyltransferase n=1 Tax=Owenia fusiformis TaxID=6347 RepID=A0A8S4NXT1_OWEFU|nr:unnamed protein product [Owenia fusiformis]